MISPILVCFPLPCLLLQSHEKDHRPSRPSPWFPVFTGQIPSLLLTSQSQIFLKIRGFESLPHLGFNIMKYTQEWYGQVYPCISLHFYIPIYSPIGRSIPGSHGNIRSMLIAFLYRIIHTLVQFRSSISVVAYGQCCPLCCNWRCEFGIFFVHVNFHVVNLAFFLFM